MDHKDLQWKLAREITTYSRVGLPIDYDIGGDRHTFDGSYFDDNVPTPFSPRGPSRSGPPLIRRVHTYPDPYPQPLLPPPFLHQDGLPKHALLEFEATGSYIQDSSPMPSDKHHDVVVLETPHLSVFRPKLGEHALPSIFLSPITLTYQRVFRGIVDTFEGSNPYPIVSPPPNSSLPGDTKFGTPHFPEFEYGHALPDLQQRMEFLLKALLENNLYIPLIPGDTIRRKTELFTSLSLCYGEVHSPIPICEDFLPFLPGVGNDLWMRWYESGAPLSDTIVRVALEFLIPVPTFLTPFICTGNQTRFFFQLLTVPATNLISPLTIEDLSLLDEEKFDFYNVMDLDDSFADKAFTRMTCFTILSTERKAYPTYKKLLVETYSAAVPTPICLHKHLPPQCVHHNWSNNLNRLVLATDRHPFDCVKGCPALCLGCLHITLNSNKMQVLYDINEAMLRHDNTVFTDHLAVATLGFITRIYPLSTDQIVDQLAKTIQVTGILGRYNADAVSYPGGTVQPFHAFRAPKLKNGTHNFDMLDAVCKGRSDKLDDYRDLFLAMSSVMPPNQVLAWFRQHNMTNHEHGILTSFAVYVMKHPDLLKKKQILDFVEAYVTIANRNQTLLIHPALAILLHLGNADTSYTTVHPLLLEYFNTIPQVDFDQWWDTIKAAVTNLVISNYPGVSLAVSFIAPIINMVCSLFLLVRLLTAEEIMKDCVAAAIVILTTSITELIFRLVLKTPSKWKDDVVEYLKRELMSSFSQPMTTIWPTIPETMRCPQVIVKTCVVALTAIATGFGYSDHTKVFNSITSAYRATDVTIEGLNQVLTEVLGIDVDGSVEKELLYKRTQEQGQEYLLLTNQQWVGTKLDEISSWIKLSNDMTRKPSSKVQPSAKALEGTIVEVSKRYADIVKILQTSKSRPVPHAIWLYGGPGLGKSEFVTSYLFSALAQKFDCSPEVYNLDSGKYSLPVLNQRWAFYDEAGGKKELEQDDMLNRLNQLISGAPISMPGASLEEKNQVGSFNCVVVCSNIQPSNVGFKMNAPAIEALLTRFEVYEVVDPQYNPQLGRDGQAHRDLQFNNLRFIPSSVSSKLGAPRDGNGICRPITTPELLERSTNKIKDKSNSYYAKNLGNPALGVAQDDDVASGAFHLPDPTRAQSSTPYVVTISGVPGSRKTAVHKPMVISIFESMNFSIEHGFNLKTKSDSPSPILFVLDDLYDFSSKIDCQNFLLQVNNLVRTVDAVLVVTNVGPVKSGLRYLWPSPTLAGLIPIASEVPGVHRRLGFLSNSREAKFLVASPDGFLKDYWEDCPSTPTLILQHYISHLHGSGYLKVSAVFPETLPFTKQDADAWWVCSEDPDIAPTVFELLTSIQISPRAFKYFMSHVNGILRQPDWYVALRNTLSRTLIDCIPDAKVYISFPSKTFMVAGGVFYAGQAHRKFELKLLDPPTYVIIEDGRKNIHEFSAGQIQSFLSSRTPLSPDIRDILAFQALAEEVIYNKEAEAHFMCHPQYKLSTPGLLIRFKRFLADSALTAIVTLKDNAALVTLTAVLALSAGLITYYLRDKVRKYDKIPQDNFSCQFCSSGYICPDVADAKGKNKGGKVKNYKMGNAVRKFWFNGTLYYDSDFEENPLLSRLHHDLSRRIKGGEFALQGDNYFVNLGTYGTVSYSAVLPTAGGDWSLSSNDTEAQTGPVDLDSFEKNVIQFTYPETCVGFAVNQLCVATTAHCVREVGQQMIGAPALALTKTQKFVVTRIDRIREIAYLIPTDEALVQKPLEGIRDYTNKLLESSDIPLSGYATLLQIREGKNGTKTTQFTSTYSVERIPIPILDCKSLQNWGLDAGVMQWGSAFSPTRGGDSGSPVFVHTKNGPVLIGLHACTRHLGQVVQFAVLTKNHLIESFPTRAETKISQEIHPDFLNLVRQKKVYKVNVAGGLSNLGSVRSSLPMDTRNQRIPIGFHSLSNVFGDLKKPALPVEETETKHVDKIPPDTNGQINACMIKMNTLQTVHTHTERLIHRYRLAARQLASYYKMLYGVKEIHILSINQALNGNSASDALELDASTGGAFQLLFPKCPLKKHLFSKRPDNTLTFADTPAGKWLEDMTLKQWEDAKDGKMLVLPATASFKSELLPIEKAWKKRIVFVVDTATVINQKRILHPLMTLLCSDGANSDFQLKTNPHKDWDGIARKLQSVNSSGILSIDFKNFDLSVPPGLFDAAAIFVSEFFPQTDRTSMKIHTILESVAHTPILVGEDLIGKSSGVLSGIYGTSLLDSIISKIVLFDVVSQLAGYKSTMLMPVEDFFQNVASVGCGDDTTTSFSPSLVETISPTDIVDVVREHHGMEVTVGEKDGTSLGYTTIHEASFCSRRFVPLDKHPSFMVSQLKPDAISGMLCWTSSRDPEEVYQQLLNVRLEMIGHGEEKYLVFEKALQQYAKAHHHKYEPLLWDTLVAAAWDASRASPMPVVHNLDPVDVTRTKLDFSVSQLLLKIHTNEKVDMDLSRVSPKKHSRILASTASLAESLTGFRDTQTVKSALLLYSSATLVRKHVPGKQWHYNHFVAKDAAFWSCVASGFSEEDEAGFEYFKTKDYLAPTTAAAIKYNRDKDSVESYLHAKANPDSRAAWRAFLQSINTTEAQTGRGRSGQPPQTGSPFSQGTSVDRPTASVGASLSGIGTTSVPVGAILDSVMTVDAAASAPIAVNTAGEAPIVVASMGGIDGMLVSTRNFFRPVWSYDDFFLMDPIRINVPTLQFSLIQTWEFNPWDANMVGPMGAALANLHNAFVGDVCMKFQITPMGMISGTLGFFFVPGSMVNRTPLTPQALAMFGIAQISIIQPADVEIVMTGSSNQVVSCITRDMLAEKSYGRLYMFAMTDIQNSFGTTGSINMNIYGKFGPNAGFSDPVATLNGISSNPIPEILVDNKTLVLDGVYPWHFGLNSTPMPNKFLPAGDGTSFRAGVNALSSKTNPATFYTGRSLSISLRTPEQRAAAVKVAPSQPGSITDSTLSATDLKLTGNAAGAGPVTSTYTATTVAVNAPMGFFCAIDRTKSSAVTMHLINGTTRIINSAIGYVEDPATKILEVDQTTFYHIPNQVQADTSNSIDTYLGASPYASISLSTIVCDSGHINDRSLVPSGFVFVSLVPSNAPLPSVKSTSVLGHTLMYTHTMLEDFKRDQDFFRSSTYPSLVTTFTAPGGTRRIQLLRNRFGWWINSKTLDNHYANYSSTLFEWTAYTQPGGTVWPALEYIPPTEFISRVLVAPAPPPPEFHPSRSGTVAQSIAALAVGGGALAGLGQGLGNLATWQQTQQLQTNQFNFTLDQMYRNNLYTKQQQNNQYKLTSMLQKQQILNSRWQTLMQQRFERTMWQANIGTQVFNHNGWTRGGSSEQTEEGRSSKIDLFDPYPDPSLDTVNQEIFEGETEYNKIIDAFNKDEQLASRKNYQTSRITPTGDETEVLKAWKPIIDKFQNKTLPKGTFLGTGSAPIISIQPAKDFLAKQWAKTGQTAGQLLSNLKQKYYYRNKASSDGGTPEDWVEMDDFDQGITDYKAPLITDPKELFSSSFA